jgi:lipopolysaccharide export system permease protein
MWPYFIGATVITTISLVLSLWVIPISQRTCVAFEEQYIPRRKMVQYDRHIYRQVEPGTFLYIRGFSPTSLQASFMAIEKYEGGSMVSVLDASEVKFDKESKRWTAQRYITRTFDGKGGETFKQNRNLDTLLNLDIVELGNMQTLVKTMNITELNEFIEQQREKGSDLIRQFEVEHHTRYAYPLGTFILTLIGVALSSRKMRGGTGLHIGVGIVLCFSYILLSRISEEFAKGGSLPTLLAVWLPNILYTIIAIYLYRKAPK